MDSSAPTRSHRFSTQECLELNDFSAAIGWETDYRQVGGGKFESSFEACHSAGILYTDQFINRGILASGTPPPDYVPILLPSSRGPTGVFQGTQLGNHDAFIFCPGSEGTFRSTGTLRLQTANVSLTRLASAYEALTDQDSARLLLDTRVITLSPEALRQYTGAIEQFVELARRAPADDSIELCQREIEEKLVSALCFGLAPANRSESLARRNRLHYVTRARDYIEAHLTSSLGRETLTRETGISARSLEYAFREILDMSPFQYIKNRRLIAARRRLIAADDPAITVTSVAMEYGFAHLGYFARDYQALFGECPSATLRG